MYNYAIEKAGIFTEKGQVMFLKIRDNVGRLIENAGAVRQQEATRGVGGDSWFLLACLDRMVELGELREITGSNVVAQHRVFVSNR